VGVGAGVTGYGGDLIVIDDPIRSRDDASSLVYRDRVWDWYTNDLYTRLEPGGSVILIMTRWHEDDLAGRILASPDSPNWTVISLPAEAEEDDPLGRQLGEPLWPERYDSAALAERRMVLGIDYSALYQQRPLPREGEMFKRAWFEIVDAIPVGARLVRYWDKAGTAGGGAYTAGVLAAFHAGITYIVDVVRGQWGTGDREATIRQTTELDKARGHVVTWIEQEPGSGGKESAEATIRNLAGFAVYADRVTGSKEIRAEPLAAQAMAGNVKIVRGPWNAGFIDELTSFPSGVRRDQVDAASGAFNKLAIGIIEGPLMA
jgi:predicted phage terminase large subunit-like protein